MLIIQPHVLTLQVVACVAYMLSYLLHSKHSDLPTNAMQNVCMMRCAMLRCYAAGQGGC